MQNTFENNGTDRRNDRALPRLRQKWLEQSYEEKLGILIVLGPEPAFDSLRSEPRFQALLQKLDLVEQESSIGVARPGEFH
jgi:hypothetical protein